MEVDSAYAVRSIEILGIVLVFGCVGDSQANVMQIGGLAVRQAEEINGLRRLVSLYVLAISVEDNEEQGLLGVDKRSRRRLSNDFKGHLIYLQAVIGVHLTTIVESDEIFLAHDKEKHGLGLRVGTLQTISFNMPIPSTIGLQNVLVAEMQEAVDVYGVIFLNMQMEVINVNDVQAKEVYVFVFSNIKDSVMVIKKGTSNKKINNNKVKENRSTRAWGKSSNRIRLLIFFCLEHGFPTHSSFYCPETVFQSKTVR